MRTSRLLISLVLALILAALCAGAASGTSSPPPTVQAYPGADPVEFFQDIIDGYGWPDGVDLLVTADNPDTPLNPDLTQTLHTSTRPGGPAGYFIGSFPGLEPGWFITVTHGAVTKTLTVRSISITEIDPATDIVHGTAAPLTEVSVGRLGTPGVRTAADDSGAWAVNLFGVYDIQPGWSKMAVSQSDEDGDLTVVARFAPGYRGVVQAWLGEGRIDGWGWPDGVDLQVTADDPDTTVSPDMTKTLPTSATGHFNGSFPGLERGWVITASTPGVVTKTHTVRNISITEIDPVTDIVRGTADPFTQVTVSPGVRTSADGSGDWMVDLSGVYDIKLGWSEVNVSQGDEDYDTTIVGEVPEPTAIPPGTSLTSSRGTVTSGTPTVLMWESFTVSTAGCGGGTATATLTAPGYVQAIPLGETPLGSGVYTGTFTRVETYHGAALISIAITGCSPATTIEFNIYIDPSGVVRDTFGYPVVWAAVTLYRSDDPGGPFAAVPDGSSIMGPGNRANPDLTRAGGLFGWDVVPGFYKVRAEKAGCTGLDGRGFAETGVLTIPPPVTDLELVLTCSGTPADLAALVESMHLDKGLANDLTHKARDAADRIAAGKDACRPLDEFARRVVDEAGKEKPKLTSPQARELLDAVYTVELTSGCLAPGSTLPAVELAVVDLIDVINGLGLSRGLENDLRNKASEAGKQAATHTGNPCRKLDELVRAGRRQLTPVQLATLTAAVNAVQTRLVC